MRLSLLHATHIAILAALLAGRVKNSAVLTLYFAGAVAAVLYRVTGWRAFALPELIGVAFAAWEFHPFFALAIVVALLAPRLPLPRVPLLGHLTAGWFSARTRGVWIFEGAIASGKTTITRSLARQTLTLFAEDVPPDLMALFYKDMARHGWALQTAMCEQRLQLLHEAVHYESPHGVVVLDRGPFGCLALATANYVLGSLSDAEYQAYRARWRKHETALFAARELSGRPVTVVYMSTPAAECIARLRARPGADSDVDERYMRLVSVMHTVVLHWARQTYHRGQLYFVVFDAGEHRAEVPLERWGRATARESPRAAANRVQLSDAEAERFARTELLPGGSALYSREQQQLVDGALY